MNVRRIDMLVVCGHNLVVEGLRKVIKRMDDRISFTAVFTGEEAYRMMERRNFDFYMLDIFIPDTDTFKLIADIREEQDDAPIIVYTLMNEASVISRLAELEVNAIISQACESREVEQAVRHVLKNQAYCSAPFDFVRRKLRNGNNIHMHKDDYPTKRELMVLKKIAEGDTTLQIAQHLGISENTVETFRKRLIQKFEARNAIDLVMKAINKGWIEVY